MCVCGLCGISRMVDKELPNMYEVYLSSCAVVHVYPIKSSCERLHLA